MMPREIGALAMARRTALILLGFVVVFTGLLAAAQVSTRAAIEASAQAEKLALIGEVLPRDRYDNDLLTDTLNLPATPELGLNHPSTVYRARRHGAPAALVVEVVAPDGYAGEIAMVLGVDVDGRVTGLRVTAHRETPGLGDYIEPRKDKDREHPWITRFTGRALGDPAPEAWKVGKDGGQFPYHTGATITPRAVVKAVRNALLYLADHQDALFDSPGK